MLDTIINFLQSTGFAFIANNWTSLIMIAVACVLLYLAIVKKFEPLLLLPIAFGMLLTNLPGADMYHEQLFAGGHVHWEMFGNGIPLADGTTVQPGLIDVLYLGVKLGIYPCLIFVGVGAMTDFGPLIANPKSLLLGAAAQLGIFATFLGVRELFPLVLNSAYLAELLGPTTLEKLAASVGIIGGADGPTAIFVTSKLAPNFLGPIAVAAYSYMALVPIIQPPVIKLLTTKKERMIRMPYKPANVSKTTRILFPIIITIIAGILAPSSVSLVGFLMFGNLIRECGVLDSLSETAQKVLANLITIFLGITIASQMQAEQFLAPQTLLILGLGLFAFIFDTAGGVIFAKFLNLFLKEKINPMIGAAGISAFPMAGRIVHKMGLKEDPQNFLLMQSMGVNVSGQIASVIAGGLILNFFM